MVFLFYAILWAAVAVILGLQWLIHKLSFPADKRYLHLRFIFALLLLEAAVFNNYGTGMIMDALGRFLNGYQVRETLDYLLPARAYDLTYILLNILALNILLMLSTLVLLRIIKWVFGEKEWYFLKKEDYVGWKALFLPVHWLACLFYSTEGEKPVLNGRGHCVGKWAGCMKWVFGVMGLLEIHWLAAMILWGSKDARDIAYVVSKAWYFLPMGGFLLADQIQTCLEANLRFDKPKAAKSKKEKTEKHRKPEGHEQDCIAALEHHEALLCNRTLHRIDQDGSMGVPDKQQLGDCQSPDILAVLCRRLKACDEAYQAEHYQRALAALLDSKHINVCDHPEGEFFIYLSAYLNLVLSRGETALILCRSSADAQRLKSVCREHLQKLNQVSGIWKLCTAGEANQNMPMNLLICSYEELVELRLLELRREFAQALKCVVVSRGEHLFALDHIRILRMFNELQLYCSNVQYILLSETDNDELRTAMEYFMGDGELLPFSHEICPGSTHMMVWQEESCYDLWSRFGISHDQADYAGTAVPLALALAKQKAPKIYIIPGEARPDLSYLQYLSGRMAHVKAYLPEGVDVDETIRRDPAEVLKPEPVKQLICYDTQYDFINAAWCWAKYAGKESSIVHVISPHYLLREYFAAKFMDCSMTVREKPMDALIPYDRILVKSNMTALLVELRDHGMTGTELLRRSKAYGWKYREADELLQACLTELTGAASPDICRYFRFEEKHLQKDAGGGVVSETFITVANTDVINSLIDPVRYAVVQVGPDRLEELPIPAGDITNYYLRDQQLVLQGYSYRVADINGGTVTVTQANGQQTLEYFPVSRFAFEDYRYTDRCVDSTRLDMNIATAKVTRQLLGYWKSSQGYRLSNDGCFTLEQLTDSGKPAPKTVSVLEINLPVDTLGAAPDKTAFTLAFILNGMFKTLFPHTHQNLFAVVCEEAADDAHRNLFDLGADSNGEAIIKSLVPSTARKPEAGFKTVLIVEYSCVEYGMVHSLYRNRDRVLGLARDYLSWYLTPRRAANGTMIPSGSELNFGGEEISGVFAPKDLLELLNGITGNRKEPSR